MQLQLPFDTALVLSKTALRTDQPDVWKRYEAKTTIRMGQRTGARIFTQLGLSDLRIIRDYLCLWINEQELLSADRQDKGLMHSARSSAALIGWAIDRVLAEAPC